MIKIGATKKDLKEFDEILQSDFKVIERAGEQYNYLLAFEQYIDSKFEYQFNTIEEYEEWLVDFVYFIIPTDFVPMIDHYSGFVKEVLIDKRFDLILESKEIDVEGKLIKVPTNVVNVIPCSATHWTDEGLAVLDAVIGSWNNQNPTKTIVAPYQFENYNDLIVFRNANNV